MDPTAHCTNRRGFQACLADRRTSQLRHVSLWKVHGKWNVCPSLVLLREGKLRSFCISNLNCPPRLMDEFSCCLKWKWHAQLQGGELMGRAAPSSPPQLSHCLSTAWAGISPSRKTFHPQTAARRCQEGSPEWEQRLVSSQQDH